MAARTRLPLQSLLHKNLPSLRSQRLVHIEAAAKEPAYPPVVPSLTAKSKSARRRQIEERVEKIRAASVQDKLSLLTRIQRMKYVVIPQTFARNADKWYQHFTKTAYLPGLPDRFSVPAGSGGDPQPGAPHTHTGLGDDAFTDIRSLVTHAILQEKWYMKKRRPFLYKEQEHVFGPFLRNLVTGLTNTLAKHNPLLQLSCIGMID